MSYTNSARNPIFEDIKIPFGNDHYCEVFPGLELWRLEQDGCCTFEAFELVEEMMASLPEEGIDFDIVEEAFELLREEIPAEDCDEVNDFFKSPLSLSHAANYFCVGDLDLTKPADWDDNIPW